MAKITVYLRKQGTREYELADPRFPRPGSYVLRYQRNGKRVWETLPDGTTSAQARHTAVERECCLLNGAAPQKVTPIPPQPISIPRTTTGGPLLDEAIDRYLANSVTNNSVKTASAYAHCLREFYRVIGNKPLASIAQQDLIDFVGAMRTEELSDRTIHNRIEEVVCFLRANGMKEVKLRVRYTEKTVRSYRPD